MKGHQTVYKEGWNLVATPKTGILFRTKRAIREGHFLPSLRSFIFDNLRYFTIRIVHRMFIFRIDGVKYSYFTHKYNAMCTERSVEIPWILSLIDVKKNILEVGNVLSHYMNFPHTVVDKYEKSPEVLNEDAETFKSETNYDLIVSISTLEHIGFDEPVKDDMKIERTIHNLKSLINDGGKMLITVPLAYNPSIDEIVSNNEVGFSRMTFLKRISKFNRWEQCALDEALKLRYGSKYPFANFVAFLVFEK